ncbi:putative amino acid dehydrogenase [Bradyrhizobium sp. GM0.4]
MLAPSQQQRIDQPLARDRRALDPVELGIDEADVERGIVDHQRRVADELQKIVDDLVKQLLRRQEFGRQPVHRKGFCRHVPFGIDVDVETLPRRHAIEHLDAADFDQAISPQRVKAGGFCVENDFAHDLGSRVRRRIRRAAAAS